MQTGEVVAIKRIKLEDVGVDHEIMASTAANVKGCLMELLTLFFIVIARGRSIERYGKPQYCAISWISEG